jgi:hypothetical protein
MSPFNALLASAVLAAGPALKEHFTITVVDEQTGRGVPLVELRTVHGVRLVTDSAGVAVFREPGLLGRTVFFHVRGHGYEFARDGFGFRGKALRVTPGGSARLTIKRVNLAERLYRVTGAGIYRDSVLAGRKAPIKEPLLNGLVVGCDSVVNAVYRGKLYWFWGDTNRPGYPLGNFQVTGATSLLPGKGGLDPEGGVDLTYFVDENKFARPMAPMPGKGPTWLVAAVALPDRRGRERLYASYVKVRPPMAVYARGLAVFDDDKGRFEKLADVDPKAPAFPRGHSFRHADGGVEYVYFGQPYPLTRVRATGKDFCDPVRYETYTCLKEGSTPDAPKLDRGKDGRLRYAWRKGAPAVGPAEQAKLIAAGKMTAGEGLIQLRDRDTGKLVRAHSGSVCWNGYRKRWVLIAVQEFGTSLLGEVWYAEGDTPVGPWTYGIKVVTHDAYSFYNPKQHPPFDKHGGRVIFFEGTYSHSFSGNPDATPRYDYNQVMYRLDLADPRLALPVPVYHRSGSGRPDTFATGAREGKGDDRRVAFYALDRPVKGAVPVRAGKSGLEVGKRLTSAEAPGNDALFYALPADAKDAPKTTAPLYEFVHAGGGRRAYSTDAGPAPAGHRRVAKPLCRVWRKPG